MGIELWTGDFGNEYVKRNEITDSDIANRTKMWADIILVMAKDTMQRGKAAQAPSSYLEVGAGQGANLITINTIHKAAQVRLPYTVAVEPNVDAALKLGTNGVADLIIGQEFLKTDDPITTIFDVVFTCGVLIHVPPKDLLSFMKKMYDLSHKYIVCIEYFSPEIREVKYRGEVGALWTNDYGSVWMDNFNVKLLSCQFYWKRQTGLDNLTCWVFKKIGA